MQILSGKHIVKKRHLAQSWLIFITVLLLLAACGGGSDEAVEDTSGSDAVSMDEAAESEAIGDNDINATGSEEDSGELPPTPDTDNKVEAPRATPNVIASGNTAVPALTTPVNRTDPELVTTPQQLDIVLLLDATGSMANELAMLKADADEIGALLATLPDNIDLQFGLVIYRDQGPDGSVQRFDLTDSWALFAENLSEVTAVGGGDYPENLNAGLHQAVTQINWRAEAERLLILLGDAPPKPNIPDTVPYDETILIAAEKNITIFTIGSDGLNASGIAIYQTIAARSNGRFTYLTKNPETPPANVTAVQPSTNLSAVLVEIVLEALDEEMP